MIIPTIDKIITAFIIAFGIWVVSKYFWMVVYQYKFGGNYGDRYIKGLISKEEKKELKSGIKSYQLKLIKELHFKGGK